MLSYHESHDYEVNPALNDIMLVKLSSVPQNPQPIKLDFGEPVHEMKERTVKIIRHGLTIGDDTSSNSLNLKGLGGHCSMLCLQEPPQ